MKLALCLVLVFLSTAYSLNNGQARTPPMGWLSWERFLCNIDCDHDPQNCISERLYKDMADRLVHDGFKELGYEYVNIDDCWSAKSRDPSGQLVADPKRFPSGIKALAEYVHSKGLKLGIYQDCGSKTCAGYPGSAGHFEIDAQTFADWNVDMLKLDGCYADPKDMDNIYPQMTKALNSSGRSIVFSCSWPDYQRVEGMKPNYKLIGENCNLWRNFDDIADSWNSVLSIIDYYAANQDDLIPATGPGRWNDPDMLIIGNFGLSFHQAKAQMALWAIFAAPLLMSNDLRALAPQFKIILMNKYVIGVNQDPLGLMGRRIYNQQNIEIWTRPVTPTTGSFYSHAIVFFNRRDMGGAVEVNTTLSGVGLNYTNGYDVLDLFRWWRSPVHLNPEDILSVKVNPSSVVMVKATISKKMVKNIFPLNLHSNP
ncbi:alpha-N-acetylgalactosaminidase-like [Tachypleus tridentatus]|uniref:alpha-N-acetylgalactosaminidase-like n=1 Tax=Tachypleus tridentatus TaxID=6853 RepID=UPI003FD42EB9